MTAPLPASRTGAEALHAAIDATGCRACGALDHPSGCAADVASYTRTGATDREVEAGAVGRLSSEDRRVFDAYLRGTRDGATAVAELRIATGPAPVVEERRPAPEGGWVTELIGRAQLDRLRALLARPDRDRLTPWEVVEIAADQLAAVLAEQPGGGTPCDSRGPRIGGEGCPRCGLLIGHDGSHRPAEEDGWGDISW